MCEQLDHQCCHLSAGMVSKSEV